MAKDLRLDVVTSANEKGLVEAAAGLDKLADKTDKVGHDFDKTAVEGSFLARELEEVKRKAAELSRQLDETGDKSLLRQISRAKSYEAQLKRVQATLADTSKTVVKESTTVTKGTDKLGKNLAQDVEEGFFAEFKSADGIMGKIGAVLTNPESAGIALAAASVLGVMIGGAVVAAIGTVALGVGIASIINNPRVRSAFNGLENAFTSTFKNAASPLVGPVTAAIQTLGSAIKSLGPGLKEMFSALAPVVGSLAGGFGQFIKEVAGGFEQAAIAAKPLLNVLGSQLLPQLGNSIASLFTTIASHSKEAIQGLKVLFAILEGGIAIVNVLIDVFSALWDVLVYAFEGAIYLVDQFVHGLDFLARKLGLHIFDGVTQSMDQMLQSVDDFRSGKNDMVMGFQAAGLAAAALAGATYKSTQAIKALTTAWDRLTAAISKDEAFIDAKNQIAGIAGELDKHTKSIGYNTQAARNNRKALEDHINALAQDRDTLVKNGMSVADANKLFLTWVKALEKTAEKAGVSKDAIKKLNDQLGLFVKPKVVPIEFVIKKLPTGLYSTSKGIKFYASGGHYQAGVPRVVGEDGPEFDIPDHSGVVIPRGSLRASQVAPMMPTAGAGGAVVEFRAAPGDRVAEMLMSLLRPVIRGPYGGNVQAALGGNAR